METANLVHIAQEAILVEQQRMIAESHPQIIAAHRAALKDFADTIQLVRRSRRLSDRISVSG